MIEPSNASVQAALVTGASRGVGRGIAIALGEAGFRVFATGRTIESAELPERITRLRCDHLCDDEVESVFAQISRQGCSLSLLVNCAWAGYERIVEDGRFTWPLPFWKQPSHRWQSMMDAGVRAAFVASSHAARMMTEQGDGGLIVNLSSWAAQKHIGNVPYGVSKAATDKMSADMAHELRPYKVAAISLYPGLVRTEAVLAAAAAGVFDLSNSESPEFIGRVIAALARCPEILSRSGTVVNAAQAAIELGVTDLDGSQPKPLSIDAV